MVVSDLHVAGVGVLIVFGIVIKLWEFLLDYVKEPASASATATQTAHHDADIELGILRSESQPRSEDDFTSVSGQPRYLSSTVFTVNVESTSTPTSFTRRRASGRTGGSRMGSSLRLGTHVSHQEFSSQVTPASFAHRHSPKISSSLGGRAQRRRSPRFSDDDGERDRCSCSTSPELYRRTQSAQEGQGAEGRGYIRHLDYQRGRRRHQQPNEPSTNESASSSKPSFSSRADSKCTDTADSSSSPEPDSNKQHAVFFP